MKRRVLLIPLLFLLALLAPATAGADQPVPLLALGFEPETATGDRIVVSAYLMDPASNPISGQEVTFRIDAEFMNTLGNVDVGTATTDNAGLAYILYAPKSEGEHTITARFVGNEVFAPASAESAITVTPGAATYQQEQPFRIPGADIRLVVVALSLVWGLYLVVTVLFWLISRSGSQASQAAGGRQ
ncbi:MAG: Ig-like domain repeat protein [Chloroflexi bacterium]|nr:Ig-like domain repeat protein [Chloroflexota bacterium]